MYTGISLDPFIYLLRVDFLIKLRFDNSECVISLSNNIPLSLLHIEIANTTKIYISKHNVCNISIL